MILICNAQNGITAQQLVLKSQWTIGQGWLGLGLSRVGAVPKEIEEGGQHYIQYVVGFQKDREGLKPVVKKVPLEFDLPTLFKLDSEGFHCFGKYIGFDEAHYKAGKPAVEQMGSYHAEFMQDQLLEISDAILEQLKTKGASKATYDDLKHFTQGDEVDASALGMNFASWQGIKEALENKNVLTLHHLVADRDAAVDLALQKGAILCRAEDWGAKFYMSDQKEYKIVCDRPASLAELAIAADRDLPAGGSKAIPSDFKGAARQLKTLGLKPADLKEAGEAHEVMPDGAQGVLDATGYANHKAVSHGALGGAVALAAGLALITGIGGYALGLRKGGKREPGKPPRTPPGTGAGKETEKSKTKKAASPPDPEPKTPTLMGLGEPRPEAGAEKKTVNAEDDIARALEDIDQGKSPEGGARVGGSPASTAMDITADNVVITGEHAAPIAGLDVEVLKAQIALIYRHFLHPATLEALQAGKPLPSGGDWINPLFSKAVNDLIIRVSAKYEEHRSKDTLRDVMSPEYDRETFVRGGAPQRVILEVGAAYITEDAARAGSPFEGGVGSSVRARAERHAGEWDFVTKGLREIMRHIGR